MTKISDALTNGLTIRESATDGSDFTNPAADYRRLFLGEDGQLHVKDSAGAVTAIGGASTTVATDAIWDAAGDLAVGSGADTAAVLAVGATAGMVLKSSGTAVAWGHASGIVQVKTAVSTSDDVTTAVTMQDSSLSLAFTPLYGDSVLHVRVDGELNAYRSAGTITTRYGWVGIYNSTNSAELVREVRGDNLVAASAASASIFVAIALFGTYTVNSTAARTFTLQYMSGEVTNCSASIRGTRTGGVIMTIMEVRP